MSPRRTAVVRHRVADLHPALQAQAILVGCIGIWWAASGVGILDRQLFPSPPQLLGAVPEAWGHGLAGDLRVTLVELLIATACFTVLGVGLGLLFGSSRTLFRIFYGPISTLFAMPKITILPLFVLIMGVGFNQKVAFGALYGVFPLVMNVMVGARSVRVVHAQLFEVIGAPWTMRAFLLSIPSMMPSFFEGLRIGYVYAGIGVLLAEMYVSVNGLGQAIISSVSRSTLDVFWVNIVAATCLFLGGATLIRIVENRFSGWRA